jgi:putative transposase
MLAWRHELAKPTLRPVIKRLHLPLGVMPVCVRMCAAYPLCLRNMEELMAERCAMVDYATVHRWALMMLQLMEAVLRRRKRPVGPSWRLGQIGTRARGQRKYLYRTVV